MQTFAFGFQFACAGASPLDPVSKVTMASYHLSVKTISRSHGRSATGAAAYRSGARIADERTGMIHDYRRRRSVESTWLLLPANAPDWATDRGRLWNAAELAETRKNSTVAREFEIALPAELDAGERQRLAVDFARELVARHGCAADVAIHQPGRDGDQRNHHAHILLSTRRLTAAGFTAKTRELDDLKTGEIGHWRERFATMQNAYLLHHGHAAQVDHRSLEAQAIDREPTIHLGPTATALERRGVPTRLGESNRAVQAALTEQEHHSQNEREEAPPPPTAERERPAAVPETARLPANEAETPAPIPTPARETCLQSLRAETARRYPTAVFPQPVDGAFEALTLNSLPLPPESDATARRRLAEETERARYQRDAERQALLSANIDALERELSEWTHHRAWLAGHEFPSATWLADKWGDLARAKREVTAAEQALDELEAAYADWRKVHKLGLLLMAGLPGSKRREIPAWEQRLIEVQTTLDVAQHALAVAQQGFEERLPAAEHEARQMVDAQRRQLAALQRRIEERGDLIQRAKAVQAAERERREAEARAQAATERPSPPPVTIQSLKAETARLAKGEVVPVSLGEADAESAPFGPPFQPEPPRSPETPRSVPVPRPKPKYPAPGG